MDHTFKVAANIGYVYEKRWIKMFDSLFIVLNESGFVKSFKFTKGTSFDNVSDILTQLASENSSVEYIFVDNCCSVRGLLQQKFPNAKVMLDLFHAVKRLLQYVPKKHPFHAEIAKSMVLFFENLKIMEGRELWIHVTVKLCYKTSKRFKTNGKILIIRAGK